VSGAEDQRLDEPVEHHRVVSRGGSESSTCSSSQATNGSQTLPIRRRLTGETRAGCSSQAEEQAQRGVNLAQFIAAEVTSRPPKRCGSTALVCSASTRVDRPSMDTSGRKVAARAEVDVGATSQGDSGSRSDWTITA
jgi:hypothetical protein